MKKTLKKLYELVSEIVFLAWFPFQALFYLMVMPIMEGDEPEKEPKKESLPPRSRTRAAKPKQTEAIEPEPETPQIAESVDALVSLGFSKKNAKARVLAALRIKPDAEVTEIIKIALRG